MVTPSKNMSHRTNWFPSGHRTIHTAVPTKLTKPIGTKYFQHSDISWSTRTLGNVARTHIATNTQKYAFKKNTTNCDKFRSTTLLVQAGTCHPPRKSVVTTAP